MKYTFLIKTVGKFYLGGLKKSASKKAYKETLNEYKEIMLRAKDIGVSNMMVTSYCLGAAFIAMSRKSGLTNEQNQEILKNFFINSKISKALMGNAEQYLSEKKKVARRKWSKETKLHKYENDWVVDIIEDDPNYDYGFDYHECGIVKLCRDEGCPELTHYLCELDFSLFKTIGLKLTRTQTIADGGEKCDFRLNK